MNIGFLETHGFRRPVLTGANRLPCGRAALEVAEGLGKFQGLNDDALLLFIVAQLSVTGQGEVLAQWVTVEAIVGHDTAEIRVAGEEDTEHVVDFTLVPEGPLKQASHTRHGGGLVGVGLDANTGVVANTEKVVDHLEALVAGGEVDSSDVGDLSELGRGVVLQEAHDGNDTGGSSVEGEFVLPHGELLDVFRKTGHDVLSVGVQAVGLVLVLVGRVENGRTERSLG